MSFLKDYEIFDNLSLDDRKKTISGVVSFFEEKAISYIVSKLKNKANIDKPPVSLNFVSQPMESDDVSFASNSVFVFQDALSGDKQSLFYSVAQNTVCAVFLYLFPSTASNPSKKTGFSKLSGLFTASIATEFAMGTYFTQDMMASFSMSMEDAAQIDE